MSTPSRTVKRCTCLPWRGRQIVLIIPPQPDIIQVRQKGRRTVYEIDLASVFDMAAKKAAQKIREERAARRKARR